MGIQGLTTYINNHSDKYFKNFKLQNCTVVIDGNSLASVLYLTRGNGNPIFGGDYNKFAKNVETIFKHFANANLLPIVVFDGANEPKKMRTLSKRGEKTVISLSKIKQISDRTRYFPRFLRMVLKNKLSDIGVKIVQSTFEADEEIAAIAKKLSCPVISLDSDFFIFGVDYIPLSTINFRNFLRNDVADTYIPCKIFNSENIIQNFKGLDKTMLHLAAAILGNDYLERTNFSQFLSHIKGKGRVKGPQKIVPGLLDWLSKENFNSAISKILECVPRNRRKMIIRKIKYVMRGYDNKVETTLDDYISTGIKLSNIEIIMKSIDRENDILGSLSDEDIENIQSLEVSVLNSEETETTDEESKKENEAGLKSNDDDLNSECESNATRDKEENFNIPLWVSENSQKCFLDPCIMTLLTIHTFFFQPLLEDVHLPHGGELSLPLLKIISYIILGNGKEINYYARLGIAYKKFSLLCDSNFNNVVSLKLDDIPGLSFDERRRIFSSALAPDFDVKGLPEELIVFIYSVIFWWTNSAFRSEYFIHSLIAMLLAVWLPGRNNKMLDTSSKKKNKEIEEMDIKSVVRFISHEEKNGISKSFLPYFKFNHKNLKNEFSQRLLHLASELQNVLFFAIILNQLLLFPFPHPRVDSFYNGTFLYNFAFNLKNRVDTELYMRRFLAYFPTFLQVYIRLIEIIFGHLPCRSCEKTKKKRKKKKKSSNTLLNVSHTDQSSGDEFLDMNNKFSILYKSEK